MSSLTLWGQVLWVKLQGALHYSSTTLAVQTSDGCRPSVSTKPQEKAPFHLYTVEPCIGLLSRLISIIFALETKLQRLFVEGSLYS